MILRKYTSLLGIGAAKIDLILPKDIFIQGEEIQGHYLIKGGIVEQYIKRIESQLLRINHMNNEETIVDSSTIVIEKQIKTDMEETLNFKYNLDRDLPTSTKQNSYCIRTKLIFSEGAGSIDLDYIKIVCEKSTLK